MTLTGQLRSFKRRRIDIPVDEHALVLDIGSGDKPHWRADVLLDRFVGAEHRSPQEAHVDVPTRRATIPERIAFATTLADVRGPERVVQLVNASRNAVHSSPMSSGACSWRSRKIGSASSSAADDPDAVTSVSSAWCSSTAPQ